MEKLRQCEQCLQNKPCKAYRRIRDSKARTTYPPLCLDCEPPLQRYVKMTCIVCNQSGYSKAMFGGKDKDTCKACVRKARDEALEAAREDMNTFRRDRHGITQEQYNDMLIEQDYRCAICDTKAIENSSKRSLQIDHDHSCCPGPEGCPNCVRALLCHYCNSGLAFFRDSPELLTKANAYLVNN